MKINTLNISLFVFFIIINLIVDAQNQKETDSLLNVLKNEKVDSNKVKILINLFGQYAYTDDKKAREFLNKAFELSQKIGFKKGLAKTYDNFGIFADNKGNYHEALKNYLTSLKIWTEIGDKINIAYSLDNIGSIYGNQGNYIEALKNFSGSLKLWTEIGNKQGIATSYNNIGNIYDNLGNYPEALINHYASLKLREEIDDKDGIATSCNNIGAIYEIQGNYNEALKNYFTSLKIWKEIDKKQGIATIYSNIGNVFVFQGNNHDALKYFFNSLEIFNNIGDKQGIAELYNNIGSIYCNQGNYPEALKNHLNSLKIKTENGDDDGIATSYINLGTLYTKLHKIKEAQDYFNKALLLSIKIGNKDGIKSSYTGLVITDSIQGNFKSAFNHHKLFTIYKDSLDNEETKKKTIQVQMTYEFEKKELAIKAEQVKKDALTAAESKKQKLIIGFMIIGLLLVIIFSIFLLKLFIQKKKANKQLALQKDEISAQRDEIETQRDLVSEQKNHIEEIHREVTDSINYAKRIQQAVLPNLAEILSSKLQISNTITQGGLELGTCLPAGEAGNLEFESFILFKPKDVVSGDFYWATKINKWLIVTVADCTGHGVPGAFMSMLGISFLNEIVRKKPAGQQGREIIKASDVLNELRTSVIDALKQKGAATNSATFITDIKDGMDIAFCVINTDTLEMQFAGANNPLYIVSSQQSAVGSRQSLVNSQQPTANSQLLELKADKQPIGIHSNMQPFTNQIYQLKKGDIIYLMSDGYEDQFGGSKHKKFLSKNLKQLLTTISQQPITGQKEILEKTLNEWKRDVEQTDDITVMGIQI